MDLVEQGKKHYPGVKILDDKLIITIGYEIIHPMLSEHYISSIDILAVTKAGLLRKKEIILQPGDSNVVEIPLSDLGIGVFKVQARCNLHGTWENEILI